MYTTSGAGGKASGMSSPRGELVRHDPGLGMLAAQLLFAVQDQLYRRLAAAGYHDLRPRHGIVIAYLDEQGSRATELAALSGRHKQIVGRTVGTDAYGQFRRTLQQLIDVLRADRSERPGHSAET
jgi:hypothetical protein